MLQIIVPATEAYDSKSNIFIQLPEQVLTLEHSLLSISKWESKWCKPFLAKEKRTDEEVRDYIRCMTLTQNVRDDVFYRLSNENIKSIRDYIEAPMTATTFHEVKETEYKKKTVLTSELLYYYMVIYGIPFECQKWHLNRLFTLLHICEIKGSSNNTLSLDETKALNKSLNAARKKQFKTRG